MLTRFVLPRFLLFAACVAALLIEVSHAVAAPEPLLLEDGTLFEPEPKSHLPHVAKSRIGQVAWVAQAGFRYRSRPGADAPERKGGRESTFLDHGYVWQIKLVDGKEYLLLTSKVGKSDEIGTPFGWVPRELVIEELDPNALRVETTDSAGKVLQTQVPRKGMIVNTTETLLRLQKFPSSLFTVPFDSVAASLEKNSASPALREAFEKAGIELSADVRVDARPGGNRWLLTAGERGGAGGAISARQQFDLVRNGATLNVRDGPNMAWVHDRPHADRTFRRKSFAFADAFFVFRESGDFVLIGSRPTVDEKTCPQAIHGWVEKRRLAAWNTSEALEWDRSSTLPSASPRRPPDGYIFTSAESAKQWLSQQADAESSGPADAAESTEAKKAADAFARRYYLSREEALTNGESPPLPGQKMRFPVLDDIVRPKHPKTEAELFRVGWFGPFVGEPGSEPNARIAKLRQQLLEEIQTVELVFVIDGTGSMDVLRSSAVPDAVSECLRELNQVRIKDQTFSGLRVRVAVFLYGENKKGELVLDHTPLSNGKSGLDNDAEVISSAVEKEIEKRIDGLASWLRKHKVMSKETDDELEPVFDALLEAMKQAKLSSTARKHVVFLGDMGDRSKEDGPKSPQIRRIVEALLSDKAAQPINFLGIQVEQVGAGVKGAALLKSQLEWIRDEVQRFKDDPKRGAAEADVYYLDIQNNADMKLAIAKTIRRRFDDLREELKRLTRQGNEYISGTDRGAASPVLRRHYEANGVDISQLEVASVQVYEVGYAYQATRVGKRNVSQLRPVCLVPKAAAMRLQALLLEITEDGRAVTRDSEQIRTRVEKQMKSLARADDLPGLQKMSLAELFKFQAGLTFKTPFLQTPLDQVERLSDEDCERMLLVAHRLGELLADDTRSEQSEWKIVRKSLPGGERYPTAQRVPSTTVPADRYFTFPDDTTKWVWLDQNLHVP